MTRNFDKQRRYDEQPRPYRGSTNKFGTERSSSSRPPRARPNRDSVDRAWEQGARQNHPDYRTRSTPQGQPSRDRRSYQQGEFSPTREQYNRRPAFGNRQDRQEGYRSNERGPRRPYDRRDQEPSHYNERGPRRPYDSRGQEGYRSDERGPRRPYEPRENAPRPYQSGRPGPRGYDRPFQERQGHSPREEYREEYRRGNDQRPQGRYDRSRQDTPRYGQRNEQPERHNERGARPYKVERIQHQGRDDQRPGQANARQQSRPGHFHRESHYTPGRAQYEGDYEHFASEDSPSTRSRSFEDKAPRHKTRPKDTEFWSEVNDEREELLDHLEPEAQSTDAETEESEAPVERNVTPKVARKNQARRPASAIVRKRKSSAR